MSLLFWLNLSLWDFFFRKIQWMCCERERSPFSHTSSLSVQQMLWNEQKKWKNMWEEKVQPLFCSEKIPFVQPHQSLKFSVKTEHLDWLENDINKIVHLLLLVDLFTIVKVKLISFYSWNIELLSARKKELCK